MNGPRTATVTAMTPCVAASCYLATFDELLRPLFADDGKELLDRRRRTSAGHASFAHSPNSRSVKAGTGDPTSGVDPQERPRSAEVAERPRRRRDPIHVGPARVQLHAETPVERVEAAVVREARRSPGNERLSSRRASPWRRPWAEELPPEREHVVRATRASGAGIAGRIERDSERLEDASRTYSAKGISARAPRAVRRARETLRSSRSGAARGGDRLPALERETGSVREEMPNVEPGGPAGSSRSTTPSSAATSRASAVTGFETEASERHGSRRHGSTAPRR